MEEAGITRTEGHRAYGWYLKRTWWKRDRSTRRRKENIKDAKRMRKGRAKIMRNGKDKKIIVNCTALCQNEHPVASSHPANPWNPFLRQQLTWRELHFTVIDSAGRFARTLTRRWSWYVTHSRCKIQFSELSKYRPSKDNRFYQFVVFRGSDNKSEIKLKVIFMITTVHQWYQSLYYPTNAHNVKT